MNTALYKLYKEGFQFDNFYTPVFPVSTADGEYITEIKNNKDNLINRRGGSITTSSFYLFVFTDENIASVVF